MLLSGIKFIPENTDFLRRGQDIIYSICAYFVNVLFSLEKIACHLSEKLKKQEFSQGL